VAYERNGFALVTCVEMHLPAAGLLKREVNRVTQALEETYHRAACLREKGVVEAGDEQGNPHGSLLLALSPARCIRCFDPDAAYSVYWPLGCLSPDTIVLLYYHVQQRR
jgi:hypothetical protein